MSSVEPDRSVYPHPRTSVTLLAANCRSLKAHDDSLKDRKGRTMKASECSEAQLQAVREFIVKQVPDWEDEVKITARFKAFSGQKCDWAPQFEFWRDLILKIALHFRIFILSPSQMKSDWFNRGGLFPLCLDDVLLEMYKAGDLVGLMDLGDPTSGRLSQLLRRLLNFATLKSSSCDDILSHHLVLLTVLKDKADDVVKALLESHGTSSCVITMSEFEGICGTHCESQAMLSYLSSCGKAKYLSIQKQELIEGVKVSLSSTSVSSLPSLDSALLHMVWTKEELQRRVGVIDRQYEVARKSALASLQSGNKKVALRYARQLKLASESRKKLTSLLDRVEESHRLIVDAESTKKAVESIRVGAQAMKENNIAVEELQMCLQELEEVVDAQKQVDEVLGSPALSSAGDEDENFEEELKKLELEIKSENQQAASASKLEEEEGSVAAESLSDAISHLNIAAEDSKVKASMASHLEAA